MLQHGQHTMLSIMLSMVVMEGNIISSRDNNNPSNQLSSLKLLSNNNPHPNRTMLNPVSVREPLFIGIL